MRVKIWEGSEMQYQKLVRALQASSRALIYIMIAGLLVSLYIVTVGLKILHGVIMFSLVVPLLITAVAGPYVVSGLRASAKAEAWLLFSIAAEWLILVASIMTLQLKSYLYLGLSLVIFSISPIWGAALTGLKSDVKLSYLILGTAFLISGLTLMLLKLSVFHAALALLTLLGLGAIYAVTYHSLPATFEERQGLAWGLLLELLLIAEALSLLAVGYKPFLLISGATDVISLPALGLTKLRKFVAVAKASKNPVARAGELYFVDGHIFSAVFLIITGLVTLLGGLGLDVPTLVLIHLLALGVLVMFVLIHAPLMLPVILRWPSARRYNLTPYVLESVAAVVWPVNPHVAFFFLGLSIVFLVLIVKPTKEPLPLSLIK